MLSLSSPVVLLGLSILYSAYALKGIDVSAFLYNFDFKDYVLAGSSDFAVFQGYRNNGSVNLNLINDSEESYSAGYTNFDMYMSPCPRCNKSASQQKYWRWVSHTHYTISIHYQPPPPPPTTTHTHTQ
jgi:hypothetical protein